MNQARPVEFGDFQTPDGLALRVCRLLERLGEAPDAIVEPTVGRGAFLVAASQVFPRALLCGSDIHAPHLAEARKRLSECGAEARSSIREADFFTCEWEREFDALNGRLLILGNPPWVTAAAISASDGANLPKKTNFLGLRGIAARTGKSNFDIAEWMLLRLLQALGSRAATIAVLCKTMTARKVLRCAWRQEVRIAHASLHSIDAASDFGVSVDACLLIVRTGEIGTTEADVFADLNSPVVSSRIGLVGRELVPDVNAYHALRHLEGISPFRWRSGVKHDCAAVMELRRDDGGTWTNGLGEAVNIEPEFVYPLLKCTDLARGRLSVTRGVLVTQTSPGEDTAKIATTAPETWKYLQAHADRFAARKSAIYKKSVPFALFGVGDYSFTPWKVAVSGLHPIPHFRVIGPRERRPVFFDDTCYFLSFEGEELALVVAEVLNSESCRRFLACLAFPNSKRPFTVDLLQRLNFARIAEEAGLAERWLAASGERANATAQIEFVMESK